MNATLVGKKIVLRPKHIEDVAKDYIWSCDPELASLDATTPLKMPFMEYISYYHDSLKYQNSRRRQFAIDTLDGVHIGNCTYYGIDDQKRETELGILIGDRYYWNKGYGEDAVTTLVNHVFETTDLMRIYLSALEWNLRAQRCFAKCGFSPCHYTTRWSERFLIMEMLRPDDITAGEQS